MTRYLLTISYIGTRFRGVQKEFYNGALTDPDSIQGILELGLQRFKPVNEPVVVLSSRTDQGVHALRTSVHVDLEKPGTINVYEPKWLMHGLNRTFEKAKADIRVQEVKIVPESFHARFSAKSRTYLYRLAVRKQSAALPDDTSLGYGSPIPMSEWKRCYFIQKPDFDVTHIQEVTNLFVGTHDLRTFMGRPNKQPEEKLTIRTIYELTFRPAHSLFPATHDPNIDNYHFFEVLCKGRSFLYRQVRRIVGVLIAVAQGKVQVSDVKHMIDSANPDTWMSHAAVVPPHGLYLLDVGYDSEDLVIPPSEIDENAGARLEEKKRALRPAQTRVTLSSGEVFVEARQSDGHTSLQRVVGQTLPGYVVDNKPDLQVGHVLPQLLVGSQDVAGDSTLLLSLGVTHVLSIGVAMTVPSVTHLHVELLDLPECPILPVLEQSCSFIHEAIASSGTVFVHCNAGVSRAPTVVIAFLVKHMNMSLEDALALVKKCRPATKPNDGFLKQLQDFSKSLSIG